MCRSPTELGFKEIPNEVYGAGDTKLKSLDTQKQAE